MTVRDDDGFRDTIFDDIEQAPPSETNGDQEIVGSTVSEISVGITIRIRGLYTITNTVTGETYSLTEVYSQSGAFGTVTLFINKTPPPAWLLDTTPKSFALTNADGTDTYDSFVCFAAGTSILTADGERAIEDLKVGDRVLTHDRAEQVLRWIGSCRLDQAALGYNPKMRPVRITAGALGANLPEVDLLVSPQHRVFVRSAIAKRMFGQAEVLVPANKLVDLPGIAIATDVSEVTYFHMMFDRHELVYSNGALSESLFTGPEALKAVPESARAEIMALFPELFPGTSYGPDPVRLIPRKGKQVKAFVARHRKNSKPILMSA